jgi:hypothetical protein
MSSFFLKHNLCSKLKRDVSHVDVHKGFNYWVQSRPNWVYYTIVSYKIHEDFCSTRGGSGGSVCHTAAATQFTQWWREHLWGVVDGRAVSAAACHAGAWPGYDSRSWPDLRLEWKRGLFSVTLSQGARYQALQLKLQKEQMKLVNGFER